MIWYPIALLFGYLLGSIPFGLILTRLAGLGDIRKIGSGNIGATNVFRTGRKDLALLTLLFDSFKAGLACLIAAKFSGVPDIGLTAGAAAFVGHCYPVWLGFRGGKGVATYAGLLLFGFWWLVCMVAAFTWLVVFGLTRMSSLAALSAALIAPLAAFIIGEPVFPRMVLIALSVLVFWSHRKNIVRILRGEEPVFDGQSSKNAKTPPK